MESASASEIGVDGERLDRLFRAIEDGLGRDLTGGSFLIARRGKVIAARSFGSVERGAVQPCRVDDVFCLFSATKPMTATLLLQRVDAGEVRLTDRVEEFIPEFAAAGKDRVTVLQVLTHTAGFPTLAPDWPTTSWGDWSGTIARIAAQAVEHEPGAAVVYHALTGSWIVAEIVRRVDGGRRTFARMMAEDLFEPLGMHDTSLGIRPDLEDRRVPIRALEHGGVPFPLEFLETFNDLRTFEVPGGGVYSTAKDVARFYQMWLGGGALDGVRILSPAIVDLATRNHTGEEVDRFLEPVRLPMGWSPFPACRGLGFFVRGSGIFPTFFGTLASDRTFGHPGASSIMAWADPVRELLFVGLTAGLIGEARHLLRFQRLSDLAFASVID